jgi:hypothetical protein
MKKKCLFITRDSSRGGAIYERLVTEALEDLAEVSTVKLAKNFPKWIPYTKLRYRYQVINIKNKENYDFVVLNRAALYAGFPLSRSKSNILIMHHYDENENTVPLVRFLTKKIFLSNLKEIDVLVVVADYWKNFFKNYIPEEKIVVIHNAFDIEEIDRLRKELDMASFKQQYAIPDDKIIVYAGNAMQVKGYKKVLGGLNNDKYCVITSGAKDKISHIEHLHLDLPYEDYIRLLCVCDIAIILSDLEEGWNRVAHEALLCHTPVIGSGKAGFGNLLRGAGQVIFDEDTDSLEEVVENVLRKKSQMTNVGYSFAKQFHRLRFKKEWKNIVEHL